MRFSHLLVSLAPLLPSTLAARWGARDTSSFKLYAYGSGIGGLEVFYYQGAAYIGNSSAVDGGISVSFSNNNGVISVTPDNTTSPDTFTNGTFAVPETDGGGPSAIVNGTETNSTLASTGWTFYGTIAMLELADGSWVTQFYAGNSSFSGVYSLEWNVTDTATDIPVTVKTTAPSNPSS